MDGTTTGQVIPTFNINLFSTGTVSYQSYTWSGTLVDGYPSSTSSTSSFKVVLPWFYGSATFSANPSTGINHILGTSSISVSGKLTKLIDEPGITASSSLNKTVTLSTAGYPSNQGYLYFGYPSNYPDLSSILDPNGFDITSVWYKTTFTNVSSPNSYWFGKSYKFYIYVGSTASTTPLLTTIGSSPSYSGEFQFKFV
ncbi:hypothetical protein EBU71_12760 [bacterium]|nr:hypothetical protein [Candidatus Elulimicrobium humile]